MASIRDKRSTRFLVAGSHAAMYKLRRLFDRTSQLAEEVYRWFAMGVILRVAAVSLPESWARNVAKLIGFVLVLSPQSGRQAYRNFKGSFGAGRWQSLRLAQQWLTRPLLDYVVFVRICHNREKMNEWQIVEHNAAPIRSLMESGERLIVATGHFAREAAICLYLAKVLPAFLLGVVARLPEQRTLHDRRMRIQFGTILGALHHTRPLDREWIVVGEGASPMKHLLEGLNQPGRVVIIAIDAHWEGGKRGSFARPFAGYRSRTVATGAARLARLSQSYTVDCVTWIDDEGRIVIEWGAPIPPPDRADEFADIAVMDRLLAPLEVAIGRRPTQYVLAFGGSAVEFVTSKVGGAAEGLALAGERVFGLSSMSAKTIRARPFRPMPA